MLWGHRENTHTQADNMPICHQKTHILISLLPKQLTRFGRFDAFRQPSPLMKPQDNGSSLVREPSSSICQLVLLGISLSQTTSTLRQIRPLENRRQKSYSLFGSCAGALYLQCVFFLKQKQEQNVDPTQLRQKRREMETSSHSDGKHVKVSPEKTPTAISVCRALYKAYVNTATFKFMTPRICCGSHLMK